MKVGKGRRSPRDGIAGARVFDAEYPCNHLEGAPKLSQRV
jgi:hypothetical protein